MVPRRETLDHTDHVRHVGTIASSPATMVSVWDVVGRWKPMVHRIMGWSTQWAKSLRPATCLRAGTRSAQSDYRDDNEDAFYSDDRQGVFVVADGVGGNHGGKIASQVVIDAFARVFHDTLGQGSVGPLEVERAIARALETAHDQMEDYSARYNEYRKMASTVAVTVICGGTLFVGHVGDSRVYLCRRRGMSCITRDDTYANALVSAGVISAREAESHPLRNVLLATVNGAHPIERVPICVQHVAPGERVLLTTDGLTSVVGEEEIWNVMRTAATAQEAADKLVQRALARDTHDNTTCIVVERCELQDIPQPAEQMLEVAWEAA